MKKIISNRNYQSSTNSIMVFLFGMVFGFNHKGGVDIYTAHSIENTTRSVLYSIPLRTVNILVS